MNPTVRFFNVAHLYTRQQPIHSSQLQSINAVWSIYTAQKEKHTHQSSYSIKTAASNHRNENYALQSQMKKHH